jgi:signal transduction histidine kinase
MRRLADVIEERRDEIVRRFVAADRLVGAATSLPDEVVANSLREFLGELAAALRNADKPIERSSSATAHGRQRFNLGYDVGTVVREYAIVRDLLFDVAVETGAMVTAGELRVLGKCLINGIADSASTYAAVRDAQLREQTRKHVAFLAHELRNPLGSARLALQLVRERGDLKPSPVADSIERGLARVAGLLDDALVSIRLDEVGVAQLETFDVGELMRQLVVDLRAEAEAKHERIIVEGSATMRGDRRALGSALSNLLHNAVKFTRRGGAIHLRAKPIDASVVIEVEDSCGGLPAGAVQKLFDPYVQLGADRSGFGLGLAIAERAAQAHGGALRVHDLPGRGCVFVLEIPVAPSERSSRTLAQHMHG